MSAELREAMLELMNTLRSSIVSLNVMIDELNEGANMLGDQLLAGVMRGIARRHRVKVLEMEGQLAALESDYAARFHLEL